MLLRLLVIRGIAAFRQGRGCWELPRARELRAAVHAAYASCSRRAWQAPGGVGWSMGAVIVSIRLCARAAGVDTGVPSVF
jgi:hypothetical protein